MIRPDTDDVDYRDDDGPEDWGHDPELPAGFRDADFEMRALQAKGDRSAALKRQGICDHGWLQGPPGKPEVTCLHCGAVFATWEAACNAPNWGTYRCPSCSASMPSWTCIFRRARCASARRRWRRNGDETETVPRRKLAAGRHRARGACPGDSGLAVAMTEPDPEEDPDAIDPEAIPEDAICPTCNGSGEGLYDGGLCRDCRGSGVWQRSNGPPDDVLADAFFEKEYERDYD